MGCHNNVGAGKFPIQSEWLGLEAEVIFDYDTRNPFKGKIIRDDIEDPFVTLIQLEDGHVVRGTECQFSPKICSK